MFSFARARLRRVCRRVLPVRVPAAKSWQRGGRAAIATFDSTRLRRLHSSLGYRSPADYETALAT
ncbi:hypothetical protein ACFWDI_26225 [Streptomyces sp. NPDC060064]|uniref:hypothetical protein n=1 Tax=Streptomyces sp. NPDC060064 TaxID=3347049 RepID=UPI0036B8B244